MKAILDLLSGLWSKGIAALHSLLALAGWAQAGALVRDGGRDYED